MEYSAHAVGMEAPAPGLGFDPGEKAEQKQEWLGRSLYGRGDYMGNL